MDNGIVIDDVIFIVQDEQQILGENQHHVNDPSSIIDEITKKKVRKRTSNPKTWKRNIRHQKYQAGEEYVSIRKTIVPKKNIKNSKDCLKNCRFKCAKNITDTERLQYFQSFYTLDQNRKNDFILRNTERCNVNRSAKGENQSRKNYSFGYFLEIHGKRIKVCKSYWLGTFSISQKRIYNVHNNKDPVSDVIGPSKRGLQSCKKISLEKVDAVRAHIKSFPAIESHYCRANTSKNYLEANLSISKMYLMYKENVEEPVKESFYRNIFCNEFNLDFHIPKSDRCGHCEKFLVAEKNEVITKEMIAEKEIHCKLKSQMREQKLADKESGVPILCFDLQNVLTCPRSEIGPMFYHSKLNIYNLTAQLSTTKKIYCAIWTEYTGGRSGNDLASALYKILTKVVEENDITELITWSDSCVPQNKNSIMTFAVQHFLNYHPEIQTITMKFSLPGHSAIQEVDNAHSQIERFLAKSEYFSPVGLIRLLKNVNVKKPLTIIQMQPTDFNDFSKYSKLCCDYRSVNFTKLKILKLTQNWNEVECSLDYSLDYLNKVSLRRQTRTSGKNKVLDIPPLENIEKMKTNNISAEKQKHLVAMFKYMPVSDITYYKVILKLGNRS